jgi:guanine deaminase
MEDIIQSNLMTHHCVQAHCTYLTSTELAQLARSGTSIAHCPLSNAYFSAKPFPLREALDVHLHGTSGNDATNPDGLILKIGLGTDIAGGYSADIMNAMRSAVMVSRMREGQRIEDEIAAKESVETESGVRTQSSETTAKEQPVTQGLAIDWKESLYLATRGGALALGLHPSSGSFVVGAPFDAQQSEHRFMLS